MSYTIKSISGKTLYVAENATDVRTAVEAAVKDGANLYRAYLAGANLAGANLARANLAGANLDRANLNRANLDGANLAGAYLAGAYLAGANLDGAMWEQVATKLEEALNAMNDGGRHWIKGSLSSRLEDGSLAYCSIGSVNARGDGTVRALALWLLGSVTVTSIAEFNDDGGTTWEDVQLVFRVAILHARRFARNGS